MAHTIFKDNSFATLTQAISVSDTSFTIDDSTLLPVPAAGQIVYATLRQILTNQVEVITYTSNTGNTVSGVTRNVNGAGALTFNAGDYIEIRIPQGVLDQFYQRQGVGSAGENKMTGNMVFLNAAGPTILNEAATAINPTVLPNQAEDTGLAWNTAMLHLAVASESYASVSNVHNDQVRVYDYDQTATAGPKLTLMRAKGGTGGVSGSLFHGLNDDFLGVLSYVGRDDTPQDYEFARVSAQIATNTIAAQAGRLYLGVSDAGAMSEWVIDGALQQFHAPNANGPSLHNVAAAINVASIRPNRADATGIGSSAPSVMDVVITGVTKALFTASAAEGAGTNDWRLRYGLGTQTNPSIIPDKSAPTTGISTDGGLNLINSGIRCANVSNSALIVYGFNGMWGSNTGAWQFRNTQGSIASPTMAFRSDTDTGITTVVNADDLYAVAGGIRAIGMVEASSHVLMEYDYESGIIASTTQTQGQRPLVSSYNIVNSVANPNDVVTLPVPVVGRQVMVRNTGANTLQIFPTTGVAIEDNGANNSITLDPGGSITLLAYTTAIWATISDGWPAGGTIPAPYVLRAGDTMTGSLFMSDAAGPAMLQEAASATNPTLIPNKTEMDTGWGWATDELIGVLGGVQQVRFASDDNDELSVYNYVNDATAGPGISLQRITGLASTFLDALGQINMYGEDNLAASGKFYAGLTAYVGDPANASLYGLMSFDVNVGSTRTPVLVLSSQQFLWENDGGTGESWVISPEAIYASNTTTGPGLVNENASSSNPTLLPNAFDTDTGIGQSAGNHLSLITQGLDILEIATTSASGGFYNIDSNQFYASNASGPSMLNEAASLTNPTLIPSRASTSSGLGYTTNVLALIVGGDLRAHVSSTNGDEFSVYNYTDSGPAPAVFSFEKYRSGTGGGGGSSGVASDDIGNIRFYSNDTVPNKQEYGRISCWITDPTSTSEDGQLKFYACVAGGITNIANVGTVSGVAMLSGAATNSGALISETATSTNPSVVAYSAEPATGLGRSAANTLTLIANSTQMVDISSTSINMLDNTLDRPLLKDYAVTHATGSISTGAITFDYATAQSWIVTLNQNITSITLNNPPASGRYGEIVIKFIQDATGSRTVTGWPSSVKWPGGTAPTITTTATTGTDYVTLRTHDGGTTWYGDFSQDYQ